MTLCEATISTYLIKGGGCVTSSCFICWCIFLELLQVCTCHLYLLTFQKVYSWCLNVPQLIGPAALLLPHCLKKPIHFPLRFYPLPPSCPSFLHFSCRDRSILSARVVTLGFAGFPAERNGELDFSTLLSIMHQQLQQEAPEEEVLEAMRMADKEQKGFILASELRAKLTGLGEKLTHGEGES